jgi:hypothetical protein
MASLEQILQTYLADESNLEDVWEWLVANELELTGPAHELAENVEDALIYYHDGHVTREDLRAYLSGLLGASIQKMVRWTMNTPTVPSSVTHYRNYQRASSASSGGQDRQLAYSA